MYSFKLSLSLLLASSASSSAANLSSSPRRHETADKKHERRLDFEDISMASGIAPEAKPRRKGQSATVEGAAKAKEEIEKYAANLKEASTASIAGKTASCVTSAQGSGAFPFFDSCAPRGKECEGGHYYRILDGRDIGAQADCDGVIPYSVFAAATPEGCVLAPIHSKEEYVDVVNAAISLHGYTNMWVGIEKNALDVVRDNNSNGSIDHWYNLDGSPAGVCDINMWYSWSFLDEPQNGTWDAYDELETQAFLFLGGPNTERGFEGIGGYLADNAMYPYFGPLDHAIYKCCAETQQFGSCNL